MCSIIFIVKSVFDCQRERFLSLFSSSGNNKTSVLIWTFKSHDDFDDGGPSV